ncbi:MAG: LytTR family transcriptional regulator DNA-binding domain-containing protein [Bacteroidales bacterium]|nr:LytTR family transcriptional regulator DNA-binding domain-containing protein [Bacteroidales bacterium]
MLKFLNKPYPFNDDLRHNAKIIVFISIGILAFLLLFQPIDIRSFSTKEIIYLVSGVAASTFLILTLNLIVLPSLFPKLFNSSRWDIKREILWNVWMLLAISSSDLIFYSKLFGVINIHFSDIGKIILLGSLPVAVLIIINQDRLLRSNLRTAQMLNKKLIEKREQTEKLVHFDSEYKNDEITLKPTALFLIKSADNYIELYYEREGKLQKHIVRSTMNRAEEILQDFDYFFRCHRSYLVNINHIKEVQGNSQGYKLYFDNIDFPALVSQKYLLEFNKRIK